MATTSLANESSLSKWSHATNSLHKVKAALENDEVTAIECDIRMGHPAARDYYSFLMASSAVPILSHPSWFPSSRRRSDLTLSHFLSLVTSVEEESKSKKNNTRILLKHTKLDFKESSALAPSLTQLSDLHLTNTNAFSKTIFLNADILPGPGRRWMSHMDPSTFLETSLSHIRSDKVKTRGWT